MSDLTALELAAVVLPDGRELTVRLAEVADAETALSLMHDAFRARPVVGAAPEALADDVHSVRARITHGTGYLAFIDQTPVGLVMAARQHGAMRLGRVGVAPQYREQGVAGFLVQVVLEHLASTGEEHVHLLARKEFPQIQAWWAKQGFAPDDEEGNCVVMTRSLPVAVEVPDADAMRGLGERLAGVLRAGDLIIASGDLGAGKTTLTQGIGAGLGVSGPVISPTFVLSRVHRSLGEGPALVHVDAYRLGSAAELEDIDLEESLDGAVTLVEWGAGVAEGLAPNRLEIDIRRGIDPDDETRWVFLTPIGPRWSRSRLARAATPTARAGRPSDPTPAPREDA